MAVKTESSKIAKFYQGKSVLLTGATGFLGRVILEKLLRSCSDLECVYLLVRSKKGLSVQARVRAILDTQLFNPIRKEHPHVLDKVVGVGGDVTQLNLGLSPEDELLIESKVHIVIHSAASINFFGPFSEAIRSNLIGTKHMLDLSQRVRQLEAFVFVSTAYSNSDKQLIEEKIYPINPQPLETLYMIETLPQRAFDSLGPVLSAEKPNYYTYSKHAAENLVQEYSSSGLPACIVRPTIIMSTHQEPFPGWISGISGLTCCSIGTSLGVIRSIYCTASVVDIIPADHVVNLILVVAWDTAISRSLDKSLPLKVYNICSAGINPCHPLDFSNYLNEGLKKWPLAQSVWPPVSGCNTSHKWRHYWRDLFCHKVPTMITALFCSCTGQRNKYLEMMTKMGSVIGALSPFLEKSWEFESVNTINLSKSLSKDDRALFPFDVSVVDWREYVEEFVHGMRRFILKEEDECVGAAKLRIGRMRTKWTGIQLVVGFVILSILLWIIF